MDPELLDILVCPRSKSRLRWDAARQELICDSCRLAFPVDDGIAVLLESEARTLDEAPAPSVQG